ncbi:PfkB family carbohydrate kinase [Streptomyces sp. HU2014]|uniref:PfkB family carbohydrate kinase n=1 Tax=Streptomyces sp. HU2014 TaxID=2939414 RepID=UPI00200FA4D0|nr:PfkB family carbohydrate kinase [Streptomyces sp. HU2014]UQI48156.1 PfkB family carbohydrate kinase [Streptomyces sp. HU2014]
MAVGGGGGTRAEVVCLGEAMVAFRPSRPGGLGDVPSFARGVGGAEANVACALAAAGHHTRWIGRVGADGFGDYVVSAIAAYGVDVSAVQRDPLRPTGVYFRTAGERAVTEGRPAAGGPAGTAPDYPTPTGARAEAPPESPGGAPAGSRAGAGPEGPATAGPRAAVPPSAPAPPVGPGAGPGDPAAVGSRAAVRGRVPDAAVVVRADAAPGDPAQDGSGGAPAGSRAGAGPDAPATASPHADAVPAGPAPDGSAAGLAEVAYYRAGSAASAMSPELVPRAAAWAGRVLHLTGITPALSAGCLALVRELTAPSLPGRPLLSFDVNYRVGLWRDTAEGPAVLAELARRCDLVFVGEDEAEAAWGLHGPSAIRAALPEPDVLVVKRGAAGAVAYVRERGAGPAAADAPGEPVSEKRTSAERGGPAPRTPGTGRSPAPAAPTDRVVSVPALRVDVVAPVGAGDAFAAGFLSGVLRGLDVRARLRHGHLMAAAALTAAGDLGVPPRRADADRLAALDDAAWGRLRLGPGWTDRPPAAEAPYAEVEDRTA